MPGDQTLLPPRNLHREDTAERHPREDREPNHRRAASASPRERFVGDEPAAPTTQPLRNPEPLTARMRIVRAVTLLVLTLVLPGSAQLLAGNRRVGGIAARVWAVVAALAVLLATFWLLARGVVLRLATSSLLIQLLAIVLMVLAVVWPLLVLDAWRLGRPMLLPRRARLVMTGLVLASLVLTTVPAFGASRRAWAAASLLDSVFGDGAAQAAAKGRYNVLLMGGDAGPDRVGTRPDSLTLASIDATTGRTVLFSLPRNLENVTFPKGSAAAKAMPQGWTCGDECLLNGIYTWGSEHRDAFPGVADPGAEAMKQAVSGITGLTVNYYVMIDLKGFQKLIDAMGGISVTVRERVPIGGGTSKVFGYIEPGTQRLDGYHALWYARSRHGANDYARMARQRCVMNAMVQQMDPATLLNRFQGIASAAQQVVSTDLPAGELGRFIDLGTKAKSERISSVAFVPPLVDPAYPDFDKIRDRVDEALIASRAAAAPSPAASGSAATSTSPASSGSSATGSSASTSAASSGAAAAAPSATPAPASGDGENVAAACSPA